MKHEKFSVKYPVFVLVLHYCVLVGISLDNPLRIPNPEATSVMVKLHIPPSLGETPVKKSIVKPKKQKIKAPKKKIVTKKTKVKGESNQGVTAEKFLKTQAGKKMVASYAQQLKVYLEQNKVYPRAAIRLRHSGIVKVKLQITQDGKFKDIEVIAPSRFRTLNQAAISLLKGLGHFKPLPEILNKKSEEFIIPIAYNLRKGRL